LDKEQLYDEADLIKRLTEGDEQAFSMIFRRYRANIYTTAFRLTHSPFMAEDAVQEVFLKLWKGRKKASRIGSLKAYLHGIAGKVILDALRQKYRDKKRQDRERAVAPAAGFHTDTEDRLVLKDYMTVLEHAISRLPNKQRQTYLLIKKEGFKREEVAHRLNVSPETVKWNLDQAMRSIRTYCSARLGIRITGLLIAFLTIF
jgi:RNA polymerase sigma-70 factor (ECF subfamily)